MFIVIFVIVVVVVGLILDSFFARMRREEEERNPELRAWHRKYARFSADNGCIAFATVAVFVVVIVVVNWIEGCGNSLGWW
jgi:hypothetical protein